MKQILCIVLICLVLAFVAGCKPAAEAAPTSASEDVSDVEEGLSDIEGLDEELDMSELEDLEAELDEIEW
jgi:outer membrane lipoprotein-sorting protein